MKYDKDVAISIMKKPVKGDKRITIFRALVAAKLNVLMFKENEKYYCEYGVSCHECYDCIKKTIKCADMWWINYGYEVVPANSEGWQKGCELYYKSRCCPSGEDIYLELDAFNNGGLCAPRRH